MDTIVLILFTIILFLLYLLVNSPNEEGFASEVNGIDPVALSNLSAMYDNGVLNVSSIKTTGDIEIGGKLTSTTDTLSIDKTMNINGNILIDGNSITLNSEEGGKKFGIMNTADDGINIAFRGEEDWDTNNIFKLKPNGTMSVPVGITSGSAYVGAWKENDEFNKNYAVFTHKKANNDKYGIMQDEDGRTAINSKDVIDIRQKNNERNGMLRLASIRPPNNVDWDSSCFAKNQQLIPGFNNGDIAFIARKGDSMGIMTTQLTNNRVGWRGIWGGHSGGGNFSIVNGAVNTNGKCKNMSHDPKEEEASD